MEIDGKRACYWISECQDPKEHGGYVPSMVLEGVLGHTPMTGDPKKLQAPWVWGKTFEDAKAACKAQNKQMGYSDADVNRIVAASMWPSRKKAGSASE